MQRTIFYSWQSDSPDTCNRSFIRECLEEAVKQIAGDSILEDSPRVDAGMEGISGSPEVASIMFRKIDRSAIFIGDVTLVGTIPAMKPDREEKRVANPNVLLEMGYAAGRLGWERIICVMNEHFGKRQEQAFDVRNRRFPIDYTLDPISMKDRPKVRMALVRWLKAAIEAAELTEYQLVQDVIDVLDADCVNVLNYHAKMPSFHIKSETTYGGLLATTRRDGAITRLLELKVLKYDYQKLDDAKFLWAYHWTYLGSLVLRKMGL
ncbi:MAG: hypothetical protein ACJ8F7_23625 [Gemmataceae bacterium]